MTNEEGPCPHWRGGPSGRPLDEAEEQAMADSKGVWKALVIAVEPAPLMDDLDHLVKTGMITLDMALNALPDQIRDKRFHSRELETFL